MKHGRKDKPVGIIVVEGLKSFFWEMDGFDLPPSLNGDRMRDITFERVVCFKEGPVPLKEDLCIIKSRRFF